MTCRRMKREGSASFRGTREGCLAQQWQEYRYHINTIPVLQGTANLGGITFADMSQAHTWKPITLPQIMQTSSVYPEATLQHPR